jgi:hypothetical protein
MPHPIIDCPVCGLRVPAEPTCFCEQPHEARCVKDHSIIEGCPYEPLRALSRTNWVQEVFKPLPPEEAAELSKYLG